MKKKNLKSLKLKKQSISKLHQEDNLKIKGGGSRYCPVTDYQHCSVVNCNELTITGCDASQLGVCYSGFFFCQEG